MRTTVWSWFASLLLLLALGACQLDRQETIPSPTNNAAVTITLQQATESPEPAARGEESKPAATQVVQPTAIVPPTPVVQPDWQVLGDERFGLSVSVPGSWIDVTPQVRMTDMIGRFGPQMILLASSFETADRLLAGEPFEQGSLVFGFTIPPVTAGTPPSEALSALLESAESADLLPLSVESTEISGSPAAYVELAYDPLGLFTSYPESMQYRILLIKDPDAARPAVFVIGATSDLWLERPDIYVTIGEQIEISQTRANSFGHLRTGDLVQGSLSDALDNIWTFTAGEGSYATISLTPEEENIDLTLSLSDPVGNLLVAADNGAAGEQELVHDVFLPIDGTYLIEAGEFFDEPGKYQLSLNVSDVPERKSGRGIGFGQQLSAELNPDEAHQWYFEGTAGQAVTTILTPLDVDFDIILEMTAPDGRTLIVLDEGFVGDAEVLTGYELPLTGEYVIIVRGFASQDGMYTLSLDEGGESIANFFDVGDLVFGDIRQGALRNNEAHAWFFNGLQENQITIEVAPTEPNMDIDVWLLDPNLQEIAMVDDHLLGESERIELTLPVSGQYLILVREFFGEPGGYEISLSAIGVDPLEVSGRIVYSDSVTSYLEPITRDAWTWLGKADDVVDIELSPLTEDRDLVLIVVDPAGNTVLTVDEKTANSSENLEAFQLTSSGEWKIVVKEFFNEGCEYKLHVSRRVLDDQRP